MAAETQARIAYADPRAASASRHMRQAPAAKPLSAKPLSTSTASYAWPVAAAPRRERAPREAWTPEFALGSAAADLIFGHGRPSASGLRDKSQARQAWRPADNPAFAAMMDGAAGTVAGTLAQAQARDVSSGTAVHSQQRRMSAVLQPNAARQRRASAFDGPSMTVGRHATEAVGPFAGRTYVGRAVRAHAVVRDHVERQHGAPPVEHEPPRLPEHGGRARVAELVGREDDEGRARVGQLAVGGEEDERARRDALARPHRQLALGHAVRRALELRGVLRRDRPALADGLFEARARRGESRDGVVVVGQRE